LAVYAARASFSIPLPSGGILELGSRPLVMGILNVTPDSFAEPGPCIDPSAAVEEGLRMELAGADLIDVGGESSRPGADPVSASEECDRIIPVLEGLSKRVRIPLSVDTYKAGVARAALAAGAVIVNDISGLRFDPAIGHAAASRGAPLILMHTRGRPKTMNDEAVYGDVVADVIGELRESIRAATAAGVPRERIIVDPGIGFAKRPAHSYGVLARLPELAAALGRPVLAGPSRKSFMQEALGGRLATERDWGTAAAVAAAVLNGAHILRVHAVPEMVQVVRVAEEIRRHG
jgi:dihydropteroate synthase